MDTQELRALRNELRQREAQMKEVKPLHDQLQKEIVFLRYTIDMMDKENH